MGSDRKHILFLSSWYPSQVHPTLGNFVQRHAEAVATRHEVTVLYICPRPGQSEKLELEDSIENDIHHTRVYYRRGAIKALSRWQALQAGLRHLATMQMGPFDVVHMNVTWTEGWQAVLLKKKWGLPFVLTEHWTGYLTQARARLKPRVIMFSRWIGRKADAICPVTENLAQAMQGLGIRGRYRVVPNVVDTHLFESGEKSEQITRFLHVSSLQDSHKNISGLLKAWKKASDERSDLHLEIGGDGPWEEFRKRARELGIREDSISFFGEQSWAGIAQKMKRSDALLLFSNYENLPCVIVEALASGMVVVSTDVGGIREHITPRRGILVPARDEDALREAILKAVDRSAFDSPEQLRNYAIDHFSNESIARQFDLVYDEVIERSQKTRRRS